MAKQVMDQIIKSGKVSRGYMGVSLQNITQDLATSLGLKEAKGALVGDVTPGAPGEKAGLKSGDVVTAINGKKVDGSDDLTMNVISHMPGETVTLDVVRDGKPMTVQVTLAQRPGGVGWDKNGGKDKDGDSNKDGDNGTDDNANVRGIAVSPLTSDLAQQIGVSPALKGVVVTGVDADSPAADAVGRGSVIVAIDKHPVTSVGDFKRLMNAAGDKPVLLTVNNGGQTGFVVVQPK
jgi:serine protease Do